MFDDDAGWEAADEVRKETSGGLYLRLKDGEKALVVFAAPPVTFRTVWVDGGSELYDPAKHDGVRPSTRYAFAVFTPVQGKQEYQAQVWEASGKTYDAISKARKKYGAKYLYEIERKGSTTDTTYSVLPERELKEGEIKYLRGIDVPDVEAIIHGTGTPATSAGVEGADPWA
jgi:hypothetical protein